MTTRTTNAPARRDEARARLRKLRHRASAAGLTVSKDGPIITVHDDLGLIRFVGTLDATFAHLDGNSPAVTGEWRRCVGCGQVWAAKLVTMSAGKWTCTTCANAPAVNPDHERNLRKRATALGMKLTKRKGGVVYTLTAADGTVWRASNIADLDAHLDFETEPIIPAGPVELGMVHETRPMATFKDRHPGPLEVSDIDLDKEEFYYQGERLTEERAAALADEYEQRFSTGSDGPGEQVR